MAKREVAHEPTITPRLLKVKDAATYLSASIWAVRKLHWERKVRGIFIGRRLLFDRADLDRYVDELRRSA
jgi:excisionase family DNA binding protein